MKMIFLCLLSLFIFSAQAELYKWIDENGETVYSDEPPHENAKPLNPPPLTTTPAIKYTPKKEADKPEKDLGTNYLVFKISSPTHDEAIKENSGNITVQLAISPDLDTKAGHSISLLVDGQQKIQGATGLTLGLKNIDRGTHSLQAMIKNKQGKTIKSSNTITFHMQRFSKFFKKAAP